jgi:hypothetical protein
MLLRSTLTLLGFVCVVQMSPQAMADEAVADVSRLSISGEDRGAEQGTVPNAALEKVHSEMKEAETALVARDASGKASAAQQAVVDELDAMIADLQRECEKCGGQCNKPPSPSDERPKPSAKRSGKPGESAGVAKTASGVQIDRTAVANLVKDLWGRLPERQREELLQPLSEEFLPEYAAEIEEYFRVLAEPQAGPNASEPQP